MAVIPFVSGGQVRLAKLAGRRGWASLHHGGGAGREPRTRLPILKNPPCRYVTHSPLNRHDVSLIDCRRGKNCDVSLYSLAPNPLANDRHNVYQHVQVTIAHVELGPRQQEIQRDSGPVHPTPGFGYPPDQWMFDVHAYSQRCQGSHQRAVVPLCR